MHITLKLVILSGIMMLAMTGYSQKGVGDKTGISRQGLNAEIFDLFGRVEEVEISPCKYTTGRSKSGTHLMLQTRDDKVLNIHLGPTTEVAEFVKGIGGRDVAVKAFRTKKLPPDNYIAKEVIFDGEAAVLRDDNLKPVWKARSQGKRRDL